MRSIIESKISLHGNPFSEEPTNSEPGGEAERVFKGDGFESTARQET
jgi:hypothetical protein